jgi:hypothetical protein
VTPQGSLGLLALGDIGIKLWRDTVKDNPKNKRVKPKNQNEQK